jgi:hypothetical protein
MSPIADKLRTDSMLPSLDALGAAASAACALHCALIPLAAAVMPYVGLGALDSAAFDRGFAAFAIVFGLVVIGGGYCRHRMRLLLALFSAAVALLIVGVTVAHTSAWHAVALALGGSLMAAAHLVNRHGVKHHGCTPRSLWRTPAAPIRQEPGR